MGGPELAHAATVVAPAANACGEDLGDGRESLARSERVDEREVIALVAIVEVDRHGCIRVLARPKGGSAMGSGRPPAGR
ncbi:MAG: hypothetical protein KIT24_12685 [Phycisphaeraceae bacterium]|nr:hypothetical protein [Phycisphaeraceae bacterium]